jgi:hypothetical protein
MSSIRGKREGRPLGLLEGSGAVLTPPSPEFGRALRETEARFHMVDLRSVGVSQLADLGTQSV